MNLNKLLCKYLDRDERGYVTVGDALFGAIWLYAPVTIVALYIHGAISMYKAIYIWTPDYTPHIWPLVGPGVCVFILGTIILAVAAGYATYTLLGFPISKILGVRVSKCERKE